MQICQGSFTATSGDNVVQMPSSFTPLFMEFEIGPQASGSETVMIRSSGWQDFTNNRLAAISTYVSGTLRGTKDTTAASITHYKDVGGVLTKIIDGSVTARTPTGYFTFTSTPGFVDANYKIRYKAFGE